MRRPSHLPHLLTSFLLTTTALAQKIVPELSFGHNVRITTEGGSIPNWLGSSANHNLQILSDRAILTPPVPGNAKGALWTEKSIDSETWIADVEFRASGQDTGSGSLNFWFVKDKTPIFLDNVYSVGNFDGLVIVIDQYGNTGGKIRGFLNDASQNFRTHSNLESLAFGHCDYKYRNLGRPSKLKVTSQNGLTVSIDGKECFSSSKISLPSGYYFGITAATGEQPDSFEVNKFIVTSSIPHNHDNVVKGGAPPIQNQQQSPNTPQLQKLDRFPGMPEVLPDKMPEEIKSQEDQFADLHNRLQTLSHQVAMVFAELEELGKRLPSDGIVARGAGDGSVANTGNLENKLDALNARLDGLSASVETTRKGSESAERIADITRKGFENIEKLVDNARREMGGQNYHEHFQNLNRALDAVTASSPRIGFFVFVVVGVQVALAASYVMYKRRRGGMPKKYL